MGAAHSLAGQGDALAIEQPELLGDLVVRSALERGQLRDLQKRLFET
jgi:hypothetical protein